MLPEVVTLAKAEDAIGGNTNLLVPDIKSLVVLYVHRGVQPLRIQTHHLGEELPRPGDSLVLEIIAEGEVAQHLEEGAVACGLAHVLDVAGADALLAGGHPVAGRHLGTGEIGLERGHTRINQQQALVVVGHQRKAGQAQMALALKEGEVHLAQLVYTVLFQFFCHFKTLPFCRR